MTKKRGKEDIAVIFKYASAPTLLAICEYVSDKMEMRLFSTETIATQVSFMRTVISVIDGMLYKGEGRKKVKGNPWGCKGKPVTEKS